MAQSVLDRSDQGIIVLSDTSISGTTPQPSSRTGSAKADTIFRLIQAARAEFAAQGLAGARIESIARNAGVTKQLVYHYYHSKEELFSAVLDDASGMIMPKLVDQDFSHLPPVQALRHFLYEIFDQYRVDPLLGPLAREGLRYHEMHQSVRNRFIELTPSLTGALAQLLKRGIESGDFCVRADPHAVMAAAMLMMTGGFTSRHSLSVILGWDPAAPERMDRWREMAADLVMATIRP